MLWCIYLILKLQLAFQSVALVSKALSLIEAGELGILSFGEQTRIVHPLGEPFTSHTGARYAVFTYSVFVVFQE